MSLMRGFRSFSRARGGLAAVEFALIAPMMIVLLLTSMELINLLQCNRRVENTAASLADVISRDTEVSDAEINGLWSAIDPLMFPDDSVGLDVRITSILLDDDGNARAQWSEQCGIDAGGGCGASSFADIPAGTPVSAADMPAVNVPDTSLIRVEIVYDFRPMLGFFTLGPKSKIGNDASAVVLSHTSFRRSRLVDPIPRV